MKLDGMEKLTQLMDEKQMRADVVELNQRAAVMTVLNLVVLCSVDTGRARGGFLPFLDKHGISAAAKLRQSSPLQHGATMNLNAASVEEGRALGSVVEQPMDIEVRNAVEYVELINTGTLSRSTSHASFLEAGEYAKSSGAMQGTYFIDNTLVRLMDWFPKLWNVYIDHKLEGRKMPGRLDKNPEFGP